MAHWYTAILHNPTVPSNTMCFGRGFIAIGDNDQVCDVSGFHPGMQAIKNVPIRTAAAAFDTPDGETLILVFGQGLWFGHDLEQSLLCPNQLRSFNKICDDIPKQFTNGRSLHGINTNDHDDITMRFKMFGTISYLSIREPTQEEMDRCRWIQLTSEEIWEPYSDNFNKAENAMLKHSLHRDYNIDYTNTNTFDRKVYATSSKFHRSSVTPTELARRWGTTDIIADATLKATTQRGVRQLTSPLSRRFRTRQTHLNYSFLRSNVYSDTFFFQTKSVRGFTCAQIFVTDTYFAQTYNMQSKSEAAYKLELFVQEYGLPKMLLTDNAMEETRGMWERVVTKLLIPQRTTEPHSGWQNKAEAEIRELKKSLRRIMHRYRCPEPLWCFALDYVTKVRQITARPVLQYRTPVEILTGDTPDASEYIHFDFYSWIKFRDPIITPEEPLQLGKWLGVAQNVGQAMCYYVLKSNGYIVARTTVRPLLTEEITNEAERKARDDFDNNMKDKLGVFDPTTIRADEFTMNDEQVETEPDLDDEEILVDENDTVHGPEPLLHAEVIMSKDDKQEIAKVIGRKKNADGTYKGRAHRIPTLDSRIFEVEFGDGEIRDVTYNFILQHLHSKLDEDGNVVQVFREIINHRKNKDAVDKADQYRDRQGKRYKVKTVRGWDLEVEWTDGTTSWLPLSKVKDSNPVDVAEYAIQNRIDHEPAFDWWCRELVKKKQRLVMAVKRRYSKAGYKFGVRVPISVTEALNIDSDEDNKLWYNAIKKEMDNVRIAFKILEAEEKIPPGYLKIPCRMIFDIKMDYTRKARLVAGGHVTDPPAVMTYSSVVSRDSVRIILLYAIVNELNVLTADVGNAYLNANTTEKYYITAGPEFGPDEGKRALIVRALYGLKSSGAAWHAHFSETLLTLQFEPCRADFDVWRRPAIRKDGRSYYEYVLVYVDDLIHVSEDPSILMKDLQDEHNYRLKDIMEPDRYLGAKFGKYTLPDGTITYYMSAELYLEKAIPVIEERFGGKLTSMFRTSRYSTPAPSDFHPELDTTDFMDADGTNLYQSYIGILRWAVELGRIDVAHFASVMSKFSALPREGHLAALIRGFAYLKTNIHYCIVFDPFERNFTDIQESPADWQQFYPDVEGELKPPLMPEPRGLPFQITLFCDAAHATDLTTRRSTTGFIVLIMGTPIYWFSKRQATIESSTFGSEFVALRIAVEYNDSLRYKLRTFGIPIMGPTNGFCDNASVVKNASLPESTLGKKHNSIAYHRVRESCAAGSIIISHEPGTENCADVLTKFLGRNKHNECISAYMVSVVIHPGDEKKSKDNENDKKRSHDDDEKFEMIDEWLSSIKIPRIKKTKNEKGIISSIKGMKARAKKTEIPRYEVIEEWRHNES